MTAPRQRPRTVAYRVGYRVGYWLGVRISGPLAWALWQIKPLRPRLARWAMKGLE